VRNFRGISSLDWHPSPGLTALIGAGDSCKTSILDAIELALTPRWNPRTSENDFFGGDTESELAIEVTVGNLPVPLLSDRKFGLDLRGIDADGNFHDEPMEGDDLVLTVRFSMNRDLEPSWTIINDRLAQPKPISPRDRGLLGASPLGGSPNIHFTWGQGSALVGATSTPDEVSSVLAEARRLMKAAVEAMTFETLDDGLDTARLAATQMGAGMVSDAFNAGFAADGMAARGSGLSLHADDIPLDRSGLGTRRLVALGLQKLSVKTGAVMLIDEVEVGLEPYRLRHLLRVLNSFVASDSTSQPGNSGQVLLTTHSPVALEELGTSSVAVVNRDQSGRVTVQAVPTELQELLRAVPESFLGRRVVVCEGKTELGVLRAMESHWAAQHGSRPMAHVGGVLALGNGTQTGARAMAFRQLGFPTAVLADSDKPLEPPGDVLEDQGATVITWSDETAIESRICQDLPWPGFVELMALACELRTTSAVRDAVNARLVTFAIAGDDPDLWHVEGSTESQLRLAFATSAQKNNWFKRVDLGQAVGEIVLRHWDHVALLDLGVKLDAVSDWIYNDDYA
jgi:hypothetical protein